MEPKISVVMPVYHSSLYLNESIESVLNQTLDDLKLCDSMLKITFKTAYDGWRSAFISEIIAIFARKVAEK